MASTANRKPLRLGHIDFVNCLPLYWGLQQLGRLDRVELVRQTPDLLSDQLVAGSIDVGPISLVEALRHCDDLVVLPEMAVTADGPVQSVCIVSTKPLRDLREPTVALGSTSRTSVELARLVLKDRFGLSEVTYRTMAPNIAAMLAECDAAVVIGDPALRATLVDGPANGWIVTDLAEEWRAWTHTPMVFAVWAARRSVVDQRAGEVTAVQRDFVDALVEADRRRPAVAAAASAAGFGTTEQMASYFAGLHFRLGEGETLGLAEFAAKIGLGAEAKTLLQSMRPLA